MNGSTTFESGSFSHRREGFARRSELDVDGPVEPRRVELAVFGSWRRLAEFLGGDRADQVGVEAVVRREIQSDFQKFIILTLLEELAGVWEILIRVKRNDNVHFRLTGRKSAIILVPGQVLSDNPFLRTVLTITKPTKMTIPCGFLGTDVFR